MIKTLFLHNLKANKVLIISFTLIIMLYGTISVGMFDIENAEILQEYMEFLPEAMVKMMGFDNLGTELTGYLSSYLYGFIMLMFPLIFMIMLNNKMIVKYVDEDSMAYIVTMPYTRIQVVLTQAIFYITSIIFVIGVNVIIIIAMSEIMFPGLLNISTFLMLNLVTITTHLLLGSIFFLLGVVFSEVRLTVGVGSAIAITFFIANMLRSLDESLEFLKFFTLFSVIDVEYILEGGGNGVLAFISYIISTILLFGLSTYIFNRKSLLI